MVSVETFRQLALAFTEAVEAPHFEKASFSVTKKIFATLDIKNKKKELLEEKKKLEEE